MNGEEILNLGKEFKDGKCNGRDYKDYHICIYPFFSMPTDTNKGVPGITGKYGIRSQDIIAAEKERFKDVLKNNIKKGSLVIICTKNIENIDLRSIVVDECKMKYEYIKLIRGGASGEELKRRIKAA